MDGLAQNILVRNTSLYLIHVPPECQSCLQQKKLTEKDKKTNIKVQTEPQSMWFWIFKYI